VNQAWGKTLALPFAWVGATGGWLTASMLFHPTVSPSSERPLILALFIATPCVAGVLGWLLGGARLSPGTRGLIFFFGTPFAGAVNGMLVGTSAIVADTPGESPPLVLLACAVFGAVCGAFFLPALTPAFVAHAKAARARPRSAVAEADRRAVLVLTVGTTALLGRLLASKTTDRPMLELVIGTGFLVGLLGLLEDAITFASVVTMSRVGGVASEGPLTEAAPASRFDFGLGAGVKEVVRGAYDAYRDAPRREVVVHGDPEQAKKILKVAVARDALVTACSLGCLLLR
jgi:hypothetical protein